MPRVKIIKDERYPVYYLSTDLKHIFDLEVVVDVSEEELEVFRCVENLYNKVQDILERKYEEVKKGIEKNEGQTCHK